MGLLRRKKDKDPFKERPIGKITGAALNIVGDIAKVPSIKNWFQGEKKLAGMTWQQTAVLLSGTIVLAVLIKYDVIEIESVLILIKELFSQ